MCFQTIQLIKNNDIMLPDNVMDSDYYFPYAGFIRKIKNAINENPVLNNDEASFFEKYCGVNINKRLEFQNVIYINENAVVVNDTFEKHNDNYLCFKRFEMCKNYNKQMETTKNINSDGVTVSEKIVDAQGLIILKRNKLYPFIIEEENISIYGSYNTYYINNLENTYDIIYNPYLRRFSSIFEAICFYINNYQKINEVALNKIDVLNIPVLYDSYYKSLNKGVKSLIKTSVNNI